MASTGIDLDNNVPQTALSPAVSDDLGNRNVYNASVEKIISLEQEIQNINEKFSINGTSVPLEQLRTELEQKMEYLDERSRTQELKKYDYVEHIQHKGESLGIIIEEPTEFGPIFVDWKKHPTSCFLSEWITNGLLEKAPLGSMILEIQGEKKILQEKLSEATVQLQETDVSVQSLQEKFEQTLNRLEKLEERGNEEEVQEAREEIQELSGLPVLAGKGKLETLRVVSTFLLKAGKELSKELVLRLLKHYGSDMSGWLIKMLGI